MSAEVETGLAAAASFAAGAAVLLRAARRRERLRAGDLGRAIFAGGATILLLAPVLAVAGLRFFGFLRLLFVFGAVVAPLFAAGVLAAVVRRRDRVAAGAAALAGIVLLGAPAGAWARYVEPYRLVLETASVPLPPERGGRDGIRIGVLADLQAECVGAHERTAVARLRAAKPDVVLIPGDLFQAPPAAAERELPALRELLASLEAPGGIYFAWGDVDDRAFVHRALAGLPIRILEDEIAETAAGDRRIRIAGAGNGGAAAAAFAARFAAEPADERIRILLVHRPDGALELPPGDGLDLVVAGHTHGGQVVLPFVGPPWTNSRAPRRIAAGGLSPLGGRWIYVSRGVGVERGQAPRVRLLCPPEVSLLVLR